MKEDTRLSYSSSTLLQNCSQRWWHYKVNKTPVDSDYVEDQTALVVGKIYHACLENTLHEGLRVEDLSKYCEDYNVKELMPLIHAMVLKYLKLHAASGLKVLACEIPIESDKFIGYVDAIMRDSANKWWIVDLKTAGMLDKTLTSRLHYDTQLNLYSSFTQDIADKLHLDVKNFGGARYRVTTKPRMARKAGESYYDYTKRLAKKVDSMDIVIPQGLMNPSNALDKHMSLWGLGEEIRSGKKLPTKNFSYCNSFFRPCPYWSKCYGEEFSTLSERGEIRVLREGDF